MHESTSRSGYRPTAATYRAGARTLPGEAFTSPEVFAAERERIFARQWNCVGRAAALAAPGDFVLAAVAGESLVVVRGDDGAVRALFNVCRHRGTRVCAQPEGRLGAVLRCPYHGWSYGRDGRLVAAPHMQEVPGFDPAAHGLHEAAVAEWEGFLFVSVAADPEPFATAFAPVASRFARFGLAALHGGHRARYEVKANWKLVFENFSECLHCPTVHPVLSRLLPYESGANDLAEGPFLGGHMVVREPHESATESGRRCAPLLVPGADAEERRRAYYYTLMPNLLLSIHPDYVNYYIVEPVAVDRTVVRSEWLFHPDAASDPAFRPMDAVALWDATNREDWQIVERSQQGVASRRYAPGPYSPRESLPAAWDREYLRALGNS